jgi:hypothetical protein
VGDTTQVRGTKEVGSGAAVVLARFEAERSTERVLTSSGTAIDEASLAAEGQQL